MPPRGTVEVDWSVQVVDPGGVTAAAPTPTSWSTPRVTCDDSRLGPLLTQSLEDLAGLRMVTTTAPDDVFAAAGAPWYLTLFGRDSLWTARLLLPLGTDLAGGTLRTLAARQGTRRDDATGEEPGKVLHEIRRPPVAEEGATPFLPPVYFGTVDATPLWVCLLHDAWRWGLPGDQVEALLDPLERALEWLATDADPDGDGFCEYLDRTGTGLANQGWKDSADAVRFVDGTLAEGPIALCEAQAYAYEAALGGPRCSRPSAGPARTAGAPGPPTCAPGSATPSGSATTRAATRRSRWTARRPRSTRPPPTWATCWARACWTPTSPPPWPPGWGRRRWTPASACGRWPPPPAGTAR